MNRAIRIAIVRCLSLVLLAPMAPLVRAQWTAPTDEELKMTSQPEVPGAAAVYLFKEEISEDSLHMWSQYVRLKVLTEKGKDYANVELGQYYNKDLGNFTVSDIQGRTIHSDGTIIPFTGKPYEKMIEKGQGVQQTAKVFTLPDVEVGSIIEYRYKLRYDEDSYYAPDWYVQSDLYTRKAHYLWKPTEEASDVSWTQILPKGFAVQKSNKASVNGGTLNLDLDVHDIPPAPDEEFMPPIQSMSSRVMFYYATYPSVDEYWKGAGKDWSQDEDKFIGPDNKMKDVAASLVGDNDSNDQKLRKIYAAVMKLENTRFTRERSTAEDKAQGLKEAKNVDDIWERKRGTDDQMAELFVALARASGMQAYVMYVTSRDRNLFLPAYRSFSQLDDLIAIVNVDGKEQFFDPGQRFCQYGHLAWQHTMTQGIRQTDKGTAIALTPIEPLAASRTQRVAILAMDEHGAVTGTVRMAWTGADALKWRQAYLKGDDTSLNHDLQTAVENILPGGMEIHVGNIENLEDYEKQLIVNYTVKGQIGSSTGKRLLLPSDIFEVNAKPTFTQPKREQPISFDYSHAIQDAVHITFPASLSVESLPASEQVPLENLAAYVIRTESTPTSVTVRREFDLGEIFYKLDEYPSLRAFFNKFETKDQEPVVLKAAPPTASGN